MLIVCTIKRAKGTHTKMPDDGTVYSFLPNEAGDHVAEVENLDHIQRLLAIDVYKPYGAAAEAKNVETNEADNALEGVEGDISPETAADLNNMTVEELQAEYKHWFGRAAPPLAKHDTLVRKVAAARMAVA